MKCEKHVKIMESYHISHDIDCGDDDDDDDDEEEEEEDGEDDDEDIKHMLYGLSMMIVGCCQQSLWMILWQVTCMSFSTCVVILYLVTYKTCILDISLINSS